ncbi:toll/interleukin-1 receptor domain-containing protein [Mesorhizobium sp. CO1-1-8]|uniref:toll/interleukin-1 receptor domain-containing protein n=1 Tax=Mesorhizobium sp. CO1-1-8 TaxID=2876631 RepID=UPI001CD17184|nr:toll/interleukin-1 receptor domain-containing protein [Mesorhizobium sp. CO1-1-8]MBZ9772900.1 toll/interleukin-1 receptor domain-containing protein [Mesorhizobium sp. CO1-1-8]
MQQLKSIFISYSWDSEDHKAWVRALAERLVANGVHVHLDQWDVRYGESLTQFMDTCLPESDFVLVVCTPAYKSKATIRQGGVGYEAQIISARIAASIARHRFVPVLRTGALRPDDPDAAIPAYLQGVLALDIRKDEDFEVQFENLLRHIYGVPAIARPQLGGPPAFVNDPAFGNALLRLAHRDVEHWELQSGVVRNELHPDTFHIPDEARRRTLKVGDVVKLMFDYEYPDEWDHDGLTGERMWVEISALRGPYFVGTLHNDPVCIADWHDLAHGSQVTFLPEHVIDVDDDER